MSKGCIPRAVLLDATRKGEAPAEPQCDGGSAGASPSRSDRFTSTRCESINRSRVRFGIALLLLLGAFLTFRGYRSFEGDQAYRLPILIHALDPSTFANDPFVAYFDVFNPHKGSSHLLKWVSRPFGLSTGILALFVATFFATGIGINRLTRATWPDRPATVGIVAAALVFFAQAGNIGTNHLFEPLLLDRLIAFALGWIAIGSLVKDSSRGMLSAAISDSPGTNGRTRPVYATSETHWSSTPNGTRLNCDDEVQSSVSSTPPLGTSLAAISLALTALIHPSLGLQLALLLGASLCVCSAFSGSTRVTFRNACLSTVLLGLAVVPGYLLNVGRSETLFEGLSREDFRLLCTELQSPQHMLPHLWRLPRWLAWACYPVLALVTLFIPRSAVFKPLREGEALAEPPSEFGSAGASPSRSESLTINRAEATSFPRSSVGTSSLRRSVDLRESLLTEDAVRGNEAESETARRRLIVLLAVNLIGLVVAWVGVEVAHNLSLTIFQPFRLATVARGLCLVLISGHVVELWQRGTPLSRMRAAMIVAGLFGDWSLVVVTVFEMVMLVHDKFGSTIPIKKSPISRAIAWTGLGVLVYGLYFLTRHDTESGHLWLLPVAIVTLVFGERITRRFSSWSVRQIALRLTMVWALPFAAFVANWVPEERVASPGINTIRLALVKRCRFAETPIDDLERLAIWSREHIPDNAILIGPPGEKTFRLWSRRGVAFNRAGSPYHAAGLADWAARFRDHVAFTGSNAELVAAYLKDRHRLESRYDRMSAEELASLAIRQGSTYVIASSALSKKANESPLKTLKIEGQLAIYAISETDAMKQRYFPGENSVPPSNQSSAGDREVLREGLDLATHPTRQFRVRRIVQDRDDP